MKVTGSTIEQLEKGKPRSRCRKWRIWATTEEGRKSKRVGGTYTKAVEEREAFVSELEAKVPNSETFAAYAERWRTWREGSGDFSPNTEAKDRRNVAALARTGLAGMRMDAITPAECRDALLWLKAHPAKGVGELSNTTVRSIYICLNSVLKQAEEDGLIASNPCRHIRPPKEDTQEKEALSPMELQLFLNRVDELPLDAHVMALYLMACIGLRRGEALALLDDDVAGGYAKVHLSVKDASGKVGPPKSKAGVRKLPIPPRLSAKVGDWREARDGLGLRDAPQLCCNSVGGVMRPENMYNWWRAHRDGLGCPGMTLHQLRHSNLSMMARHMTPFDLQRYAGWSSIEPAKVYIHEDIAAIGAAVAEAWADPVEHDRKAR